MEDIFLKIIAGEIPSHKVYEDEDTYAFLDINPVNPGHTLVIPKKQYRDMFEIPEEVWGKVMATAHRLAPVIMKAVHADGINIMVNNKAAAGQIIWHTHVHIVPRFSDDGFSHWPGRPYQDNEAENVLTQITNLL